ncbi:MAG TPA: rhomboid family intramembrane serine protease [Symbiobacteriaceae bacterium]|nr:rhomboid family intramembrane serine protease [Symbiobacteriaceae bacterium]
MPFAYIQEARQRFTEFGGFVALDPAELPESIATWADCMLVRDEVGLTTVVTLLTACPEGAMKTVRDDLTVMADRMAREARTEVQALLLIITGEQLTRDRYERLQELKVNRGAVRLVPWVVDLTRNQVFQHQGPPFGIDPDLETLAVPEPPVEEAPRPPRGEKPPAARVTIALLGIIGAVWLAMTVAGGSLNATEEIEWLLRWGAVGRPDMWITGHFWRMLTSAFLHIGFVHLAMNSMSLWMVGRAVEWLYGPGRMLFIYLVAGVIGSLISAVLGPPLVLSAGASGAIFGLLGAIIWYRISSPLGDRIKLRPLLVTLGINLVFFIAAHDMLDNWNHAGGLAGGMLAAAVAGVPAVEGLKPPRWRMGRPGRIIAAAALVAVLGGYLTGLMVPPGSGRDLAAAELAYDRQRYAEAAVGYERAVSRQGDEPYLRYKLIRTYVSLGKCNQARAQLIQLDTVAPDYGGIPELRRRVHQCTM